MANKSFHFCTTSQFGGKNKICFTKQFKVPKAVILCWLYSHLVFLQFKVMLGKQLKMINLKCYIKYKIMWMRFLFWWFYWTMPYHLFGSWRKLLLQKLWNLGCDTIVGWSRVLELRNQNPNPKTWASLYRDLPTWEWTVFIHFACMFSNFKFLRVPDVNWSGLSRVKTAKIKLPANFTKCKLQ